MGRVVSVSTGPSAPLNLGNRVIATGIAKGAVEEIQVGTESVEGDFIGDGAHHGGPDQVLYVYFAEHYRWWEEELGEELAAGRFGENVVLEGFADHELRIGDRFSTEGCTFELSAPRIPCSTLSAAMDRPDFVVRFIEADRPGFYARVLKSGTLRANDLVHLEPATRETITMREVYREWYARPHDPEVLAHALRAPLARRTREKMEGWLR